MVYEVSIESFDNHKKHSILETWRCKAIKEVKVALGEALDLICSKDGIPEEQKDYQEVANKLALYTDEIFVKTECDRLKKMWKAYEKALDSLESGDYEFELKLDRFTTLKIKSFTS